MGKTTQNSDPRLERAAVRFRLNGEPCAASFAPHKTLLEVLREDLGLVGTKHGCELGECGTCAVLVDGRPVLSCLVLGLECEGRAVETIEGMATAEGLHPLQRAFADLGAAQCGYCTPGFLLTAKALLEANPKPTLPQMREALAGNICRCTGYVKIFEAVELAAAWMRGEAAEPRKESLYGYDFDESGLLPTVSSSTAVGAALAAAPSKAADTADGRSRGGGDEPRPLRRSNAPRGPARRS
ncbi:MAG TPA: (2Fe-2S)-binding protein [Thermoanaerobaculia bacterium]|nr:(2Fe-2S)-binding protein [Thermoanaerobaculia bacterium]